MELVSFIIPHFNSTEFLKETLSSLFSQTFSNIEVIVVDDGSSELEIKRLFGFQSKWPNLKIYKRPENLEKGANSCRNFGLSLSLGNFVNFVDSDDILISNKIDSQLEVFKNDESLGMVVCKTAYFKESTDKRVSLLQQENFHSNGDFLYQYISRKAVWCTNSALIKRSSLGEIKFKEGQIDAHEWLFFIKLMLSDVKVSAVNEVLILKRIHRGTIGQFNIKVKLPSLLESRQIIFLDLYNSSLSNKNEYIRILIQDINGLLRTVSKNGEFIQFDSFISFFGLNMFLKIRAYFLFFVFFITKRGYSLNVILPNEKNFNISGIN